MDYLTLSSELVSDVWASGDMSKIQGVVNVIGTAASWIISVVGFGIVIFSILKNAFSGLYVINPTLWDKVAKVKEASVGFVEDAYNAGAQKFGKGNAVVTKLGGVLSAVLDLLPNIKELTDFNDDDLQNMDKKKYFMKSIPALIAQIFIGMLIWYGYPAKIANWIGTGTTYIMSGIIDNSSPQELVNKLYSGVTTYNLSTDDSGVPFDKNINNFTKSMMKVINTKYGMKKEVIQPLAYQLEEKLMTAFSANAGVVNQVLSAKQGYKVSVNCVCQTTAPVINAEGAAAYWQPTETSNMWYAQTVNGSYTIKYWIQGSELTTGVEHTTDTSKDYFVWTVNAQAVAVSDTSSNDIIYVAGFDATTTEAVDYVYINTNFESGNEFTNLMGQTVAVKFIMEDGTTSSATGQLVTQSGKVATEPIKIKINKSAKPDMGKVSVIKLDPHMTVTYSQKGANEAKITVNVSEIRLGKEDIKNHFLRDTFAEYNENSTAGRTLITVDALTGKATSSNSENK